MSRDYKGNRINKHVNDYCLVDLETTDKNINNAKIIEISAIKVRDNKVVEEFSTLVNPFCHIPRNATSINHISDEMVQNAPSLEKALSLLLQFLGNDIIVGFNISTYDTNLIYDSCIKLFDSPFENDFIDVYYVARHCLPELENYKLETICSYLNLDITGEHRALKDCYLTKDCYDYIFKLYGDTAFTGISNTSNLDNNTKSNNRNVQYSLETLKLQKLKEMLTATIEDGQITEKELFEIKEWVIQNMDMKGNYPYDRISKALELISMNGLNSSEELIELQDLFESIIDPVKNIASRKEIPSVYWKHICVTGDFAYGSREDVINLIESAGGIFDKTVKKDTDYLCVGANGSDNWKTGNYGEKVIKAMKFKDDGRNIEIVEEDYFIPLLLSFIDNNNAVMVSDQNKDNNWRNNIREMLKKTENEYHLQEGALFIRNDAEDDSNDDVNSYSICIWEMNYPNMPNSLREINKIIMTIVPSKAKTRPNDIDLMIREEQEKALRQYLPKDALQLERTKSDKDNGNIRIRFRNNSLNLIKYVEKHVKFCLDNYVSKADRFACCSLYEKCSDAKKCLHENLLYSKACFYREQLEKGHIFYGKNRNID